MLYQYNNIYKRKKVQTEDSKKTKCSYCATWYYSYCSKKKKVANQNGTVDEQWKTLYEQWKNIVEKRAQIDDWEKIKNKSNE